MLLTLKNGVKKKGVACEKPVDEPLHRKSSAVRCTNSDKAYEHVLSIPSYPTLSMRKFCTYLMSLM